MNILAIESSCDETSAAVVSDGRNILSNIIASQIDIHKLYGGVVPEIASRNHIKKVISVVDESLTKANCTLKEIDAIAVTYGPGLVGALLVGVSAAKAIAFASHKPLIGVHHIEGHISANYLENKELEPPFLCLVVSGGHTNLVIVKNYGEYDVLGKTQDDAAGEAFDKVARAIGLGYPGGPKIQEISENGNKSAIPFPRAKLENPFDFSFSGVKSSVLNYLNSLEMKGEVVNKENVAASFQEAVVDVLVSHTISGAQKLGFRKIAMAGGVAANASLRKAMKEACEKEHFEFYYPSTILCTDNAAMIASAAFYDYKKGYTSDLTLNAVPNLKLGSLKFK